MKYENMSPNVSIGERIVKNLAHRAGLLDCKGKQNFNFHLLTSTLPTKQGLWRAVAAKEWYKKPAVLSLFVIFSSLAIYTNSLSGDFIWDDIEQIVENPAIKDIGNIPSFFTSDLWRLISNPTIGSYYYRPFFLLSLAVDYNLWELNPFGYHITNLILHALASFLIYQIGRRLFLNSTPAFLGSMLFAVHPVHVESVAWISGRTDPMAALFFLLSFYLYMLFKDGKGFTMLVFSLTTYLFSLLSKEIGITLPLLLLVYELSFKPQAEPKHYRIKSLKVIGIYLIISLVYLYMRALVLGEAIGEFSASPPLEKRIYTSFGVILDYIRIMVLPVNLKLLYDIPLRESIFDLQVISSLLLLCAVFIATLLTYRKDQMVFFAAAWFFITILPVSNIVPLRPTMMAERYLYIPSVGICLLGGLVFYKIYQTGFLLSPYLKVLIFLLFIILSAITLQRNRLWKDEATYFAKMAEDAPQNTYAHHNLGETYRKAGNMDNAIKEWQAAIQLYPLHPEANNSLANIALIQGNYPEAVRRYKIAIQGRPENPESHYNIALALERLGDADEAAFHYREFIRRASPKYQDIIEQVKARLSVFNRDKREY